MPRRAYGVAEGVRTSTRNLAGCEVVPDMIWSRSATDSGGDDKLRHPSSAQKLRITETKKLAQTLWATPVLLASFPKPQPLLR
jgi:hypothetical protein